MNVFSRRSRRRRNLRIDCVTSKAKRVSVSIDWRVELQAASPIQGIGCAIAGTEGEAVESDDASCDIRSTSLNQDMYARSKVYNLWVQYSLEEA